MTRGKKALKGIFPTYKKLRDGSTRTYWYHRATGKRLPGEFGSAEFLAALLEAENVLQTKTETLENSHQGILAEPEI